MTDTVTLSMPGPLSDFLEDADLQGADRQAFEAGEIVWYGAGYGRRITASLDTHQYLLECCWTLAGGKGVEATRQERREYRMYADRIEQAKKAEG